MQSPPICLWFIEKVIVEDAAGLCHLQPFYSYTNNLFLSSQSDSFEVTEREDFEEFTPWKSPLLLKLSIIFMLTQMSGQFLEEWSGQTSSLPGLSYLASASKNTWPGEILFGRLFQIVSISGFYTWRLYRADDWTWNPWLTPQWKQ